MKKRILGAAIIVAIVLPILLKGGILFALLSLLLGLLAFKEIYDIKYKDAEKKIPFLLQVLSYLCVAFLIMNNYESKELAITLDYRVLSLFLITYLLPVVITDNQKKYNIEDAMYLLASTIFIGLSFNLLILMRNFSLLYILYFFIITVMTDTFGLFTGMFIGKHPLAKKISPKKTMEGLIGGTLMGVFAACTFYLTVINPDIDIIHLLIVTVTLSLMGQFGDLVFSAIKRHFGKKDFSNLIPGHGGILDRFDSIIFVIITAILFMSVI